MSRYTLILLPFVLGLSGPGFGAEVGKSNQIELAYIVSAWRLFFEIRRREPTKAERPLRPSGAKEFQERRFQSVCWSEAFLAS